MCLQLKFLPLVHYSDLMTTAVATYLRLAFYMLEPNGIDHWHTSSSAVHILDTHSTSEGIQGSSGKWLLNPSTSFNHSGPKASQTSPIFFCSGTEGSKAPKMSSLKGNICSTKVPNAPQNHFFKVVIFV